MARPLQIALQRSLLGVFMIMSFDPGETTGYSVWKPVDDGYVLVACGQVWALTRFLSVQNLVGLARSVDPSLILVEHPPTMAGKTAEAGRAIYDVLAQLNVKTVEIYPGQWKPWAKTQPPRESEVVRHASSHTRDAINMARWWLASQRLKEVRL